MHSRQFALICAALLTVTQTSPAQAGYDVCVTALTQLTHAAYTDRGDPITCYEVEDVDSDLRFDQFDNCPYTANPDQLDEDLNYEGDVCDYHAWLPSALYVL